jgi:uncharacterized protein (TIGR04255 family)
VAFICWYKKMKLLHDPIVEMILDIDCAMPPNFDLAKLETKAHQFFGEKYPKLRKVVTSQVKFIVNQDANAGKATNPESQELGVQSLQSFTENEKGGIQQLVQIRTQGYSFNRVAPYTSLDDYLPEIRRTWELFLSLAEPSAIYLIRLRFINRILIPHQNGLVDLDQYLVGVPSINIPNTILETFLTQVSGVVQGSQNNFQTALYGQPLEATTAPVIFDNTVFWKGSSQDVKNWDWILEKIKALRELKNQVFYNTLTQKCLDIYQKPK